MPRGRSGGSRAPLRRAAPARAAPPPARAAPAQVPAPAQPAMMQPAQPKQPGMFAQMATTAAGVAVGSAVGHTIGHAMTSGGGNQEAPQPAQEAAPAQYASPPQYGAPQPAGQVCSMELKQFLECAQTQTDISLCQGFNQALRECKMANGMSLQ